MSTFGLTGSLRSSDTTRRSARRQVERATWQLAAAGLPPGRMNSLSAGRFAFKLSSHVSSSLMCFVSIDSRSGMESSPPKSKSAC